MTSPQIGRELQQAREQDLRRAAERYHVGRLAREGRPERTDAAAIAVRPGRWLMRLAGATLRH